MAALTYICGLATRCRCHVEGALVLLRGKGDDGKQTGAALEHVVASQVLRSRPYNEGNELVIHLRLLRQIGTSNYLKIIQVTE